MATPVSRSMFEGSLFVAVIVSIVLSVHGRYSDEAEFSIKINARSEECFFQTAKKGCALEADFQVLDTNAVGDQSLTVSLTIDDPEGNQLGNESLKIEGNVRVANLSKSGDYKICLDNRHALVNSKVVYLEVFVEHPPVSEEDDDEVVNDPFNLGKLTVAPPKQVSDEELRVMLYRVDRINMMLELVERNQARKRSYESRKRNLVEHNHVRLNFLTMVTMVFMVFICIMQVFVIRSFFDDKSPLRSVLKLGSR